LFAIGLPVSARPSGDDGAQSTRHPRTVAQAWLSSSNFTFSSIRVGSAGPRLCFFV